MQIDLVACCLYRLTGFALLAATSPAATRALFAALFRAFFWRRGVRMVRVRDPAVARAVLAASSVKVCGRAGCAGHAGRAELALGDSPARLAPPSVEACGRAGLALGEGPEILRPSLCCLEVTCPRRVQPGLPGSAAQLAPYGPRVTRSGGSK